MSGALQVLAKSFSSALLLIANSNFFLAYMVGDHVLYQLYLVLRGDHRFWRLGASVPLSVVQRCLEKVVADFSSCWLMRNPLAMHSAYFLFNQLTAHASVFVSVHVYVSGGGDDLDERVLWMSAGSLFAAWALTYVVRVRGEGERSERGRAKRARVSEASEGKRSERGRAKRAKRARWAACPPLSASAAEGHSFVALAERSCSGRKGLIPFFALAPLGGPRTTSFTGGGPPPTTLPCPSASVALASLAEVARVNGRRQRATPNFHPLRARALASKLSSCLTFPPSRAQVHHPRVHGQARVPPPLLCH
jgi:hypothetical protein